MIELDIGEGLQNWVTYKPSDDMWKYSEGEVSETTMQEFVFDYKNIKVGWGLVQRGQSPSYKWRADNSHPEPKPTEEHKAAMSVDLYFKGNDLQGVYSWTTNAFGPVKGIHAIYERIFKESEGKGEKLPVLKYIGHEKQVFNNGGDTKIPQFEITRWTDRPADWDAVAEAPEPQPEPVKEESTDNIPF